MNVWFVVFIVAVSALVFGAIGYYAGIKDEQKHMARQWNKVAETPYFPEPQEKSLMTKVAEYNYLTGNSPFNGG
jgi:hypothetical protein